MQAQSQVLFQKYLLLDEKIVRSGQQDPHVTVSTWYEKISDRMFIIEGGAFVIFMALRWTLFIWFTIQSTDISFTFVFPAIVFFCFFGFLSRYMVKGRFVDREKQRKDMHYALTNQRILFLSKNHLKSICMSEVGKMTKAIDSQGFGTIIFEHYLDMFGYMIRNPLNFILDRGRKTAIPAFRNLEDAQKVYDLIIKMSQEYKPKTYQYDLDEEDDTV